MKKIAIIIWCTLCIINVSAQHFTYQQFLDKLNELEKVGDFELAYTFLQEHKENYPDNFYEISKEEIYINEKLLKFEENLSIFKAGHGKGYFYLIHPNIPNYKPYKEFEEFNHISERDLKLREDTLQKSKTIYEVELPLSYSGNHEWPVCFIFHGGGSNLEKVKEHWHSDTLDAKFIKIYFQSYRHYDSNTYGWRSGDDRADKEIMDLFLEIIKKYPIDTTTILTSGISAGGTFAIDMAIRRVLPVSGILTFCPGIPKILETEYSETTQGLKTKVFMVGGETDHYLPRQKQIAKTFSKLGISYKHEIVKGMGHQYPENESIWIDKGIQFLLNRDI